MAGYDLDKDKKIQEWKNENTGLIVSIQQYDTGEPKLQIGPRILKKQDGTQRAPAKAGRLTIEDVLWLHEIIDEVKEKISDLVSPK